MRQNKMRRTTTGAGASWCAVVFERGYESQWVRGALVTTNGGIESFEINVWENYFEMSDFSSF